MIYCRFGVRGGFFVFTVLTDCKSVRTFFYVQPDLQSGWCRHLPADCKTAGTL